MTNELSFPSTDDIDQQRKRIEHDLYKNTTTVHRNIYTARKLVNRQRNFPFYENLKVKDDVATAAVPGDSVFTQDASEEDFYTLATKYPIITRMMDKPPDESVYPDIDPKRTPLSEYGAQYGYDPHRNLETHTALQNLISSSQLRRIPETTYRYYHNAGQWQRNTVLYNPLRIPEDNLGTSLDTSGKEAMNTEYMRTIGLTGSMRILHN